MRPEGEEVRCEVGGTDIDRVDAPMPCGASDGDPSPPLASVRSKDAAAAASGESPVCCGRDHPLAGDRDWLAGVAWHRRGPFAVKGS